MPTKWGSLRPNVTECIDLRPTGQHLEPDELRLAKRNRLAIGIGRPIQIKPSSSG